MTNSNHTSLISIRGIASKVNFLPNLWQHLKHTWMSYKAKEKIYCFSSPQSWLKGNWHIFKFSNFLWFTFLGSDLSTTLKSKRHFMKNCTKCQFEKKYLVVNSTKKKLPGRRVWLKTDYQQGDEKAHHLSFLPYPLKARTSF